MLRTQVCTEGFARPRPPERRRAPGSLPGPLAASGAPPPPVLRWNSC